MDNISKSELKSIFKEVLIEHDLEKENSRKPRLFTINQTAKRLCLAHATVKKLIYAGRLKATPDNRITEKAINEYLGNTGEAD